ncbi:hypothetical protein NC651_039255 [Populus alba x Populus x berolinensis]|nr:hypothetical protein NC651_039255 [Populus alba x Populus x berolinensis]
MPGFHYSPTFTDGKRMDPMTMDVDPNIFLAIRNHPILSLIGCVSIYDLHVCHLSVQGQDSSVRNKDKYYPEEGTSLKSIDHAPSTISRSWW